MSAFIGRLLVYLCWSGLLYFITERLRNDPSSFRGFRIRQLALVLPPIQYGPPGQQFVSYFRGYM